MSTILITGGAGYVGSHSVLALKERGHKCIVIDDLSTGAYEFAGLADEFYRQDITMHDAFNVFSGRKIDCVLHCAGKAIVSESICNPALYWQTNLIGTKNVIDAFPNAHIVFSSTCAVYGSHGQTPITIDTLPRPSTPYGNSKLAAEYIVRNRNGASKHVIFRYFNVAGADPACRVGEIDKSKTRLIPNLLRAATCYEPMTIFRANDETPDGTCVREYVHPADLARAHVAAVEHLIANKPSFMMNLGGEQASTLRIKNIVCNEIQSEMYTIYAAPREGDPAFLCTAPAGQENLIGWSRQHDLCNIIMTAAAWWRKMQTTQRDI